MGYAEGYVFEYAIENRLSQAFHWCKKSANLSLQTIDTKCYGKSSVIES